MNRSSLDLDRRAFANALAAGAHVVAFDTGRRRWVTGNAVPEGTRPVPALEGRLLLDGDLCTPHDGEAGEPVRQVPVAVLLPACTADVARMLCFAAEVGVRAAVRGQERQGALPDPEPDLIGAALLIDLRTMGRIRKLGPESIRVEAGASWQAVLDVALRSGLTLPVLPDNLDASVSDTLAAGGLGSSSWRYGALVDNTLSLKVVTGSGRAVECSAHRHRSLFESVLAGRGQCAVVTEARLRLMRAPQRVRIVTVAYTGLAPLLHDLDHARRRSPCDHVNALIASDLQGGWLYLLSLARYFDLPTPPNDEALRAGLSHVAGTEMSADVPYADYAQRFALSRQAGDSPPPVGVLLPAAQAHGCLSWALERLHPGRDMFLKLYAWDTARFTRPMLRLPAGPQVVAAVLSRHGKPHPLMDEYLPRLGLDLLRKARQVGGTFHPDHPVRMAPSDWVRHYGPGWPALVAAKWAHDPRNVLASGPDLF